MKKTLIAGFGIALVLLAAAPVAAQEENLETVRQDLLRYVSSLQKLPPDVVQQWGNGEVDLASAEMSVRALTTDELRVLKTAMDRMPYWGEVAGMLESSVVVPQSRGEGIPGMQNLTAEIARKQLLAMMDIFASVPAEVVPADYHERVARVKAEINLLSPTELLDLQATVEASAPAWSDRIQGRVPGEGPVQSMSNCGSTLSLNKIKCEIDHIFTDIGNIASSVAGWATGAVSSIKDGLLGFLGTVSAILPSEQTFQNFMGNVGGILSKFPDAIRIPCMEDGSNFIFFGEVGTLPASNKWERTAAFAGNVVEEALPDDVWSGNLKAIGAVVNFIPQHILRCFKDAYEDRFRGDQDEHRSLVALNLNATVSSRASQIRVNDAQNATNDVIGDVANLEAKLDALGAEVGGIEIIQIRKRTYLGEFRDEALRLHIEVDLLRQSNFRISLFQLPEAVGGHLETARDIVAATLASRNGAGVDVKKATSDFNAGLAALANGKYKDAYGWFRKAYQRSVM